MNTSSRRNLLRLAATGVAVMAITPARDLLAQVSRDDRSYESLFTGSVVELLDLDWTFSPEFTRIEDTHQYVREAVVANSESTRTSLEIEFLQPSVTPEQYIDIVIERYEANWDVVEIADSGTGPDGPWFAASLLWSAEDGTIADLPASAYCEYQAGAYEGEDLVIQVTTRPESFEEGVNLAQTQVLVGDLPPLTMLESSQILALTFPVLVSDTASSGSTTSTSDRSSRSSRRSGEEEESTTSSRSENQTDTTTTSDYPDAVLTHRTEFMGTFNQFAEALASTMDDAATDADKSAAFTTIDGLAEQWLGYPERAAQLVAPAEYSSLEGLYITWADEIATLGSSYLGLYDGTSNVDTMFDQIDVVDQADRALVAELNSL